MRASIVDEVVRCLAGPRSGAAAQVALLAVCPATRDAVIRSWGSDDELQGQRSCMHLRVAPGRSLTASTRAALELVVPLPGHAALGEAVRLAPAVVDRLTCAALCGFAGAGADVAALICPRSAPDAAATAFFRAHLSVTALHGRRKVQLRIAAYNREDGFRLGYIFVGAAVRARSEVAEVSIGSPCGSSGAISLCDGVLNGCAIKVLDISSFLCGVVELGNDFLSGARHLTTLVLGPPLRQRLVGTRHEQHFHIKDAERGHGSLVEVIGHDFCRDAASLQRVSLGALTRLREMGDRCFACCTRLAEIEFGTLLSSLRGIGSCFALQCSSLVRIDLSGLAALEELGSDFMAGCSSLEECSFGANDRIKRIADGFLCGTRVRWLDLSGLSALTAIGSRFCAADSVASPNLESAVFGAKEHLGVIGNEFLCSAVARDVDLSGCTALTELGRDFMRWTSCRALRLGPMPRLRRIGSHFSVPRGTDLSRIPSTCCLL